MKLHEMKNAIASLGTQIMEKSRKISDMAAGDNVDFTALESEKQAMDNLQKRMNALQDSYRIEEAAQAGRLAGVKAEAPEEKPGVTAMRSSNEYARAFAYALKNGINRRNGRGNERVKILYDALTESGGTPAGEDGGFLVPIDIDNQIRQLMRELNPLADLVTTETVSAPTGWRVKDTAPTTGFTLVNEMGTIPQNDQPAFAKITYSLAKYGLILPISNELLSDEVANLMSYVSQWFARKLVICQNGLILTKLQTLTASTLTSGKTGGNAVDGVKTVLNKVLDPAISARAVILCNQNGFDELDQLKDDTGRGLLQPDPTNATAYRAFGRPVHVVSMASMPNISGTTNTTDFYIGDLKQFATLFQKGGLEIASTDIGGSAWATDSTEVRGIVRQDVEIFDGEAVARRNLAV